MTLLNQELGALATAVAAELGEGWSVEQEPQGWHGPAHLAGPDGEHLVLFSHWNNNGRLIITPVLPPRHLQGIRARTIAVNETLGGPVVAREITRRLLPGYRSALARIAADNEFRRGHFLRRRALAKELAALLGGAVVTAPDHTGTTTVSRHHKGAPSVEVDIHYTAERGDLTAQGLSPDQLRAIATFLTKDT